MSIDRLSRFLFPKELNFKHIQNLSDWGIRCFWEKQHTLEYCPKCGAPSKRIHSYRTVKIKDEPIRGKAVFHEIKKRRLWCKPCKKPFTEPLDKVKKGHRTTRNFKRGLCWAAETFCDLKKVRKDYRCSYKTLYEAVYENYRKKLKERTYPFPERLGIDEHSLRKPKYAEVEFATVIVDHTNKRAYELIDGKTIAALEGAITDIPGKENVKAVSMDLSEVYRSFIKRNFTRARIVADRFHVQRLFTKAVNKFRMKVTGNDRKNPIRRLLLRNTDKMESYERRAVKLWLLDHHDLREVYETKEAMHRFYKIKGYKNGRKALLKICDRMGQSKIPKLRSLRKVLLRWFQEILEFFRVRISNGRVEGYNRKAKLVQRRAYGYRSFRNYRLSFLNACM
jgi:transposase